MTGRAGGRQSAPPGGAGQLAEGLVLTALLAAVWLSLRPYPGITHDARLYMAQALHRLGTPGLESDLFFKYGSQDSFSVFSLIFAPTVARWGPGAAHLVFSMAGQAFWLVALCLLARSLFGRGWLWLASMGVAIAMNPYYGWGVLSYGEPFVTPRLFAEAMTMLALAAVLHGRKGAGIALVFAAGLLHPLMALPGLAVILAFTLPVNLWTALGAAGALCGAAALALLGVEPFGRAVQFYDPEWLNIVRDRTPHAFIADWSWRGPALAVFPLSILSLHAAFGLPRHARLARIVLVVAAGFVLMSWLGGELLKNVLVLNLQLWRGLWIFTLIGNLLAVQAVLLAPKTTRARACLILAIAANVISSWTNFYPFSAAAIGLAGLLALGVETGKNRPLALGERLALDLVVAVALAFLIATIAFAAVRWAEAWPATVLFLRPAIAMAALGLLLGWGRFRIFHPVLAVFVPFFLAAAALGLADQRSAWTRYVEDGEAPDSALSDLVSDKATYWERGLELLWFKLKRPSFYSCPQGAGIMFYRDTALEHERRSEIMSRLNTEDFEPYGDGHCYRKAVPDAEGPSSAEQLVSLCRSLPDLDLIVLQRPVDGLKGRLWRAPVPWEYADPRREASRAEDPDPRAFHFYSCEELRRSSPG